VHLKKVIITTEDRRSEIIIGGKWTEVAGYIPIERTVVITDENIFRIYGEKFPSCQVFCIRPGEKSKNLDTIENLGSKLLSAGVDRGGFILGIGGGVVCDIAGFLASVYMRGIRFGFVSSSLLSQVDASVGGKNGVNLGSVKNIFGTFNQPEFVICDTDMLKTLPEDEYLSGLAELIKMGAALSKSLLDSIEKNKEMIMARETKLMESLVYESVRLKADIVSEDEKESGKRKILNFGHTFGHVIEAVTGQKHGLAIASGMKIAAVISVLEGMLQESESKHLIGLLGYFSLLKDHDISVEVYEKMIGTDKKREGADVSFVLLEAEGKALIKKISVKRLTGYIGLIEKIR
jgi:3-dehydroquinate synthase